MVVITVDPQVIASNSISMPSDFTFLCHHFVVATLDLHLSALHLIFVSEDPHILPDKFVEISHHIHMVTNGIVRSSLKRIMVPRYHIPFSNDLAVTAL